LTWLVRLILSEGWMLEQQHHGAGCANPYGRIMNQPDLRSLSAFGSFFGPGWHGYSAVPNIR
jgi:hypothetical protein